MRGDLWMETFCITSERFADEEPVPGSLARTCPRSFGFVRVAHFAQDDTERHSLICKGLPGKVEQKNLRGVAAPSNLFAGRHTRDSASTNPGWVQQKESGSVMGLPFQLARVRPQVTAKRPTARLIGMEVRSRLVRLSQTRREE